MKRVLGRIAAAVWLTCASGFAESPQRITARQIVDRIQKNTGVRWRSGTVDGLKAGSLKAPVTGIATTMTATMDVLRAAAVSGRNLIITHEPTLYDHFDKTIPIRHGRDSVVDVKRAFIEEHGLIVWRFHDHWHYRRPDGINQGVVRRLGWERFADPAAGNVFTLTLPAVSLGALASEVKSKLNARALRFAGDPAMTVTRVALMLGSVSSAALLEVLRRDDVEVEIVGEAREWQAAEYVRDGIAQGKRKSLIIVGHVASEQPGMEECARWLRTFITEVPIEFIPASDPFTQAK